MHSTADPRSGAGRAPAPAPSTSWREDRDTYIPRRCWLRISCRRIAQKLEQGQGQLLGSECGGTCSGFKGLIFTWLAREWARSRRQASEGRDRRHGPACFPSCNGKLYLGSSLGSNPNETGAKGDAGTTNPSVAAK